MLLIGLLPERRAVLERLLAARDLVCWMALERLLANGDLLRLVALERLLADGDLLRLVALVRLLADGDLLRGVVLEPVRRAVRERLALAVFVFREADGDRLGLVFDELRLLLRLDEVFHLLEVQLRLLLLELRISCVSVC